MQMVEHGINNARIRGLILTGPAMNATNACLLIALLGHLDGIILDGSIDINLCDNH